MENNNEKYLIKPLNSTLNEDKNQLWICPLDCGNDDVCDKCDSVCKPTVS